MRVAVLYNDVSKPDDPSELDILDQLSLVQHALDELGHVHAAVPVVRDVKGLLRALDEFGPDAAFNLVESVTGQAELHFCLPAILDMIGLPYTGASTSSLMMTTNKIMAKKILVYDGIPTPAFSTYPISRLESHQVDGPWIVKPAMEDASIGIDEGAVLFEEADLAKALPIKWKLLGPQPLLVEHYIDGREFNLSILGGADGTQVLSPVEMTFEGYHPGRPRVVSYRAKWEPTAFEYNHTVRKFEFCDVDNPLLETLGNLARKCWETFGLRGYARVDFRVDQNGQPWVLEINANPCLSPDAGFMATARHHGLVAGEVVARILEDVSGP
jgi:D-alanine-D-alanine ligase